MRFLQQHPGEDVSIFIEQVLGTMQFQACQGSFTGVAAGQSLSYESVDDMSWTIEPIYPFPDVISLTAISLT